MPSSWRRDPAFTDDEEVVERWAEDLGEGSVVDSPSESWSLDVPCAPPWPPLPKGGNSTATAFGNDGQSTAAQGAPFKSSAGALW